MKKFIILIALLGLAVQGFAQTSLQRYASYDLEEHTNAISDVLRVRSGACINFGYLNMQWHDPAGLVAYYPDFMLHGFNYNGDFLLPIWGPFGLDINMIGMSFGMGNVKGESGGPYVLAPESDGDFATHMSWNVGLMPVLNFFVTPTIQVRGYAGVKAYLQFMLDGTDPFPINTLNDGVKDIGKMGWLNKSFGFEVVFNSTGIRLMYEDAFSGRLNNKFYEDHGLIRDVYDPRYKMISLGVTFWMD